MYQLLDFFTQTSDICVNRNESLAIVDSEDAAFAALTPDGCIAYHNRAFAKEHAVDYAAALGTSLCELLPDLWEQYRSLLAGHTMPDRRVIILRAAGSGKPVGYLLVHLNPRNQSVDYYKMLAQNDSSQFLEHYSGLYVADPQACTLAVNPSYEKIAFLPESEVRGRNLQELQDKGYFSRSVTLQVLERLKYEQIKGITFVQKIITGKEALVTGVPVYNEEGKLCYVLTFVNDFLPLQTIARKCENSMRAKYRLFQTNADPPGRLPANREAPLPCFSSLPIVARDPLSIAALGQVASAAAYDSPVLLLGETGVGKDLFVKYLYHLQKKNEDIPFVTINCSAIPHELLESELFGYEEGAFSGARRGGKRGLFEEAGGGILFLDEVGEMSLSLQAKLLSALDEGFIRRIGGNKAIRVKTRVVCATNRDLAQLISRGAFRDDLYYRINVLTIRVPALRERPGDILPLLYHFARKISKRYGVTKYFSTEAQELLLSYSWPGNVRELRNLVERLMIFAAPAQIAVDDLPPEILNSTRVAPRQDRLIPEKPTTLKKAVRDYERRLIAEAIDRWGNPSRAARILGVDPTTLSRKLRRGA